MFNYETQSRRAPRWSVKGSAKLSAPAAVMEAMRENVLFSSGYSGFRITALATARCKHATPKFRVAAYYDCGENELGANRPRAATQSNRDGKTSAVPANAEGFVNPYKDL